jgi:ribosomal protein S18 acetylase RimI-like enzyme
VSQVAWPYYARPRLGIEHEFTAADVERVRERQRELRVPPTFEWVHETAPTLLAAMPVPVVEAPLLVLASEPSPPAHPTRLLDPDDPALPAALKVGEAVFGGAPELAATRARMRGGLSTIAVAEDESGPVAVGTLRPIGAVAEIVGVATLPAQRRRGLGAAVTAALVRHAQQIGVRTVFLSAATDDVARLYERLGFRRTATACFVQ